MLVTTEGIVLHTIKYGEKSIIATIYTREHGRQGFLMNGVFGSKQKNKSVFLQPLFLVNLVAYEKQTRDIQRVKEISLSQNYQTLPFDILKSTQLIFLAEILFKTLAEQESYPELFDFIRNSLIYFDLMEAGKNNFHLYFLFRLTEYLGFMPDLSVKTENGWFDMKKGEIVTREPSHPLFMNVENTRLLRNIAALKLNSLENFTLDASTKRSLLGKVIDYYRLHFGNLGEIKSLKILQEIFV